MSRSRLQHTRQLLSPCTPRIASRGWAPTQGKRKKRAARAVCTPVWDSLYGNSTVFGSDDTPTLGAQALLTFRQFTCREALLPRCRPGPSSRKAVEVNGKQPRRFLPGSAPTG